MSGVKTASELALEYWDKPPIERINNTVQDYVYDYQQKRIDELELIIGSMGGAIMIGSKVKVVSRKNTELEYGLVRSMLRVGEMSIVKNIVNHIEVILSDGWSYHIDDLEAVDEQQYTKPR